MTLVAAYRLNLGTRRLLLRKSLVFRAATLTLLTLAALELVFQFTFPYLPVTIIEQMPQYRQRMGFQLNTEHGVQEYPAGKTVTYEISKSSGDLYKLTCLSPDDAPPFAPYRVEFQRDAHGFRNPEPWPQQVDLVVIGDSFTAAEAIVAPFWRDISDSMLVLGLPGSGTLQQQRLMEAFALPRQPRVVVLAFFAGNDLQDNLTYYQNTVADGNNSGATLSNPLNYSVLFNIAYTVRNTFLRDEKQPCHFPQMARTVPPTPVAFYAEFLKIFALDSQAIRESEMYRLTREAIGAMASMFAERGSRLILMYIPQKAELYWDLLSEASKSAIVTGSGAFDLRIETGELSANLPAQRDLIAELATGLDMEFLDLTPPLSNAISKGEQPYFFADTHWNQTGHNIARIALLDFLNQSNLGM